MTTRALFDKYHIEELPHRILGGIRLDFMADGKVASWGTIYVVCDVDVVELHCPDIFLPLAVEWLVNHYPGRSICRVT